VAALTLGARLLRRATSAQALRRGARGRLLDLAAPLATEIHLATLLATVVGVEPHRKLARAPVEGPPGLDGLAPPMARISPEALPRELDHLRLHRRRLPQGVRDRRGQVGRILRDALAASGATPEVEGERKVAWRGWLPTPALDSELLREAVDVQRMSTSERRGGAWEDGFLANVAR